MMRARPIAAAILLLALTTALPSPAQRPEIVPPGLPPALEGVEIEQRLGNTLPLAATFRDQTGREVALADYFGGRPVVLALVYYECPMLCGEVLRGLTKALKVLRFEVGSEFDVVTVSIDPRETPAQALAKKEEFARWYGRPGAQQGWHFLTGAQQSIDALAEAAGFRYTYDPKTGQYAHGSAIMVVTPQGRLAQYFYGIEYSPRDLRLALVEASEQRIGSLVDRVLLYCFHYDPLTGQYNAVVRNLLRVGGLATALLLGGFIALSLRRESRARRRSA